VRKVVAKVGAIVAPDTTIDFDDYGRRL
jgi:hypothetical protein